MVPGVNRRHFLASASAAVAALGTSACQSHPRRPSELPTVIDTHTHFYDPRRPEGVPWPPKEDAFLHRPVLPPEYERMARPLGIGGTVVVEASPRVADNDWVLELAERDPFLIGLVGHLKPGRAGFAGDLARLSRNRRFRGIRTGGWDVALAPENRDILADLRQLSEAGLALDVLGSPEQLPQMARLAAALPDLRIVIDHCANVRIDGQAPPEAWRAGLAACARHPNVFMKVSGLVEGTGKTDGTTPLDTAFYRPVLDAIWEAFGQDRLIFGSNWPVSARFAALPMVHRIVADYFAARGPVATARYFGQNAVRAYALASRPS